MTERTGDLAFLALALLLFLGFYAASRGLRLKHQREIIARLEDLRQRQEEMADRIGQPVQPTTAAIKLETSAHNDSRYQSP